MDKLRNAILSPVFYVDYQSKLFATKELLNDLYSDFVLCDAEDTGVVTNKEMSILKSAVNILNYLVLKLGRSL